MTKWLTILTLTFFLPALTEAGTHKVPIIYKGVVKDSDNGKAIGGATIQIENNGQLLESTKTDKDGYFKIKLEGPFSRIDKIRIFVHKEGFKKAELKPVPDNYIEISLRQKEEETIPFMVPIGRKKPVSI